MNRSSLFTLSVAAHVAVAAALGAIEIHRQHVATAIEFAEAAKPKEPPKPPPPPPPPKTPPQPRKLMAKAPAAAPNPAAPPPPSFADVPDLGLALADDLGGAGVAVAVRAPAAEPPPVVAPKPVALAPAPVKQTCKSIAKPRPLAVPPPAYPEVARSQGVSGKVRVELIVDEEGNVVDVRVLQPLAPEFDAAAVAAARRARFEPARECGKAARSKFTIAMRFSAG